MRGGKERIIGGRPGCGKGWRGLEEGQQWGCEWRRVMFPCVRCLGKNSLGEAELTTRVYTAGNVCYRCGTQQVMYITGTVHCR